MQMYSHLSLIELYNLSQEGDKFLFAEVRSIKLAIPSEVPLDFVSKFTLLEDVLIVLKDTCAENKGSNADFDTTELYYLLQHFPPSVQKLKLKNRLRDCEFTATEEFLSLLPKNLKYLSIGHVSLEPRTGEIFASFLPEDLLSLTLIISKGQGIEFISLPQNLEHLYLNTVHFPNLQAIFPPTLKYLKLYTATKFNLENFGDDFPLLETFDYDFHSYELADPALRSSSIKFPPNLINFCLSKELILDSPLPETIKSFSYYTLEGRYEQFSMLPRGLESLGIAGVFPSPDCVKLLPRGLKSFVIWNEEKRIITADSVKDLPPGLRELRIYYDGNNLHEVLQNLPEKLEELNITSTRGSLDPKELLRLLPPLIKYFQIMLLNLVGSDYSGYKNFITRKEGIYDLTIRGNYEKVVELGATFYEYRKAYSEGLEDGSGGKNRKNTDSKGYNDGYKEGSFWRKVR